MKTLIRLTRHPYEEPHEVHLSVEASNGSQCASIDFYANASDLSDLGSALIEFPFGSAKEHIYEIGSEDSTVRWAFYLRFRFFLIRPTGDAGIELRFNNNREAAPEREIAEFTIQSEVAAINRLGDLLKDFGRLEYRVLEWDGSEGHLSKPERAEQVGDLKPDHAPS